MGICPIMTAGQLAANVSGSAPCKKEKCEVWNHFNDRCGLLVSMRINLSMEQALDLKGETGAGKVSSDDKKQG